MATRDRATELHGPAGEPGPPSVFCRDGRRAAAATVVSIVLPVAVGAALSPTALVATHPWATLTILVLAWFDLFAAVYVGLTLRAFATQDPDEFHTRMTARTTTGQPARWRPRFFADGPAFALESTVFALVAVLVLPHVNVIAIDDLILVPVTLSVLFSSWALSIAGYALHYAQRDLEQPGLEFPGERTHTFADYRYFAIAVATTFGATDVNITTPAMRRVVNLHTLLTFVYNSVIVALLASFLIR